MTEGQPTTNNESNQPEELENISDYIETLNTQATNYLHTVEADLHRLHPGREKTIDKFVQDQTQRNDVLKDALSSQLGHYDSHAKIQDQYNVRLQEIYNASVNFDNEFPEPNTFQVVNYDKSMDKNFAKEIAHTVSFQDVFDILEAHKYIVGTKGIYDAKEMIGIIQEYRSNNDEETLIRITRTGGLRQKVLELSELEKINKSKSFPDKKPLPEAFVPHPVINVEKKKKGFFARLFSR